MSIKYVLAMYLLVPVMLALLTYSVLLDLVGEIMAVGAGAGIATLWFISFCNMLGKPINWDK